MDYRGRPIAGSGNAGYNDDPYIASSSNASHQDASQTYDPSGYASYESGQYPQQQYTDHQHQQQYYGDQQYYNDAGSFPMMDPTHQTHLQSYYEDPDQQAQPYYEDPSQHQAYYSDVGGGAAADWNMMISGGGEAMMMDQPQQQVMMMHQHHDGTVQTWPGGMGTQQSAEKGSYFQESEFSCDLLFGHAVSALALDPLYECMYVAGTTQSLSTTRFNAHRASLLLTYTAPNLSQNMNGESYLYSSVAGHPEASSSTLQTIYQSLYGISKVLVTPQAVAGPRGRNHPPSHAYLPPYGGGEQAETVTAPHMMYSGAQHHQSQQPGHLGITDLFPLGNGYTASVSPSAVRIHSYGGLQLNDHTVDGMLCGTIHPHSGPGGATHISVGGLSAAAISKGSNSTTGASSPESTSKRRYQKDSAMIHCLDLWQGLRPIYSQSFKDQDSSDDPIAVTAMATSHERASVVAGCSDGKLRILDGSLRELANVKSHLGGVSSISVSSDGLLIATTGFSSKGKPTIAGGTSSALYAFPDPKAYIYDIRYLGRGGISHPFAGVKGAPRFARFLPDIEGCASNRLLLASGKPGGGVQILTPFEPQDTKATDFLLPQLQQGEAMTAVSSPVDDGDELAVGTSQGRVIRYRLAGYEDSGIKTKIKGTTSSSSWAKEVGTSSVAVSSGSSQPQSKAQKQVLDIPPFGPPPPDLSLDPTLLEGDQNMRNGTTEEMRSIFGTYTLLADPIVTYIGNTPEDAFVTFGDIGSTPIIPDKTRTVSKSLLKDATIGEREYMLTVPTSKLGVDLLSNHTVVSKRYKGKKITDSLPNPNKALYSHKISLLCYEDGFNGDRTQTRGRRTDSGDSAGEMIDIPPRYQLQSRPAFSASGAFDPSDYNDTGLMPGWDYQPSMPNSWVSPVLLMFYFIPEVRAAVLASQFSNKSIATKSYEKALAPELGFVFDQMEKLSKYGLLYPTNGPTYRPKIGAWVPGNFLTFVTTMPEAEKLQILDGSPAAVDRPRRPESFYRFLAYQLDKELSSADFLTSRLQINLMDSINGIDFWSSNEFIESRLSPTTQSVTRALTLELNYDMFPPGADKPPIRFGELLQHSMCRGTRLRAWNSKSRSYETIIQRKIVTSLPNMLTLACACAGRKVDDGLWAWRTDHGNEPWLPEFVEVELLSDGNVEVVEFHQDSDGSGNVSTTFRGKASLPAQVSKLVSEVTSPQKRRYRLDAVLAYVADSRDEEYEENMGHHVLHARIPKDYMRGLMKLQAQEAHRVASGLSSTSKENSPKEGSEAKDFVLSASVSSEEYLKRADAVDSQLAELEKSFLEDQNLSSSDWVLYNGFKVCKTFGEDARAFHVPFKEPVLVVFRAVNENGDPEGPTGADVGFEDSYAIAVPEEAMKPPSLSSVKSEINKKQSVADLREGKVLAFDAEFVAVQEEESTLSEAGQKLVLRDTRHALGRISLFDCIAKTVLVDDHVLPREPVVDFLTRFSGIVAEDLDPSSARHRIISTRNAYLQMRYLMERGCIFVGHGLKQDFAIANLVVPPHQILDTVEIFHQQGMRYVSLRFLANYVLGRDMQQDIHDSVEDAQAAFELYQKALQWKKEGVLSQRVQEMYSYGEKTSWKLGVEKS